MHEQNILEFDIISSTNGLKITTFLSSTFLQTTKLQTFLQKHSCTTSIPCSVLLWDYASSIPIKWVCLKSIDIQVDIVIVTTCVIYVDEQVSPFLDYLGPHMTSYSNSHTYKTVKLLVISFPLSS